MINFITKYFILKLLSVDIFSRPFAHSAKRSAEGLAAGILLFWLLSVLFPPLTATGYGVFQQQVVFPSCSGWNPPSL